MNERARLLDDSPSNHDARNLAHLNIATFGFKQDDPRLAGFFDNLKRINQIAESSDGFVWRAQDEASLTSSEIRENEVANISVWRNIESLTNFTYRSAHAEMLARRHGWFQASKHPRFVLWWISERHRPTLNEGVRKLRLLSAKGPSPAAFTFACDFPS